jgi:saccharopine dehydrogenase (NAD+, L-lysine forming)
MANSSRQDLEHRSAITPTTTKALQDAGYTVHIECSLECIFDDSEFEAVGAAMVPENSWREALADHFHCGLEGAFRRGLYVTQTSTLLLNKY